MSSISNKGRVEEKRSSNIKAISTAILALSIGGCMGGGSGSMRRGGGGVNVVEQQKSIMSVIPQEVLAAELASEYGLSSSDYTLDKENGKLVIHFSTEFADWETRFPKLKTLVDAGSIAVEEGSIKVALINDSYTAEQSASIFNEAVKDTSLTVLKKDDGSYVVKDKSMLGLESSFSTFKETADHIMTITGTARNIQAKDNVSFEGDTDKELVIVGDSEQQVKDRAKELGIDLNCTSPCTEMIDGKYVGTFYSTTKSVTDAAIASVYTQILVQQGEERYLTTDKDGFNPDEFMISRLDNTLSLYGKAVGLTYSNFGLNITNQVNDDGHNLWSGTALLIGSEAHIKGYAGNPIYGGGNPYQSEAATFTGKTWASVIQRDDDENDMKKDISGNATYTTSSSYQDGKLELDFGGDWHKVMLMGNNALYLGSYGGNFNMNDFLTGSADEEEMRAFNQDRDDDTYVGSSIKFYGNENADTTASEVIGSYAFGNSDTSIEGVFGAKKQ